MTANASELTGGSPREPKDEKTQEELLEALTNRKIGYDETVDWMSTKFPFFAILQTFEANQPYFFVICGLFICMLQQIAFVINPHFEDAWGYLLGEDIATILYSFHFPLYDPLFNKSAQPTAVLWMAIALLVLGIIVYIVIAYCRIGTGENEKQDPHFVYFNRALFHAMSTWMLVPALQLCFVSMVCGFSTDSAVKGLWMFRDDSSATCWGQTHVISFVAASLFLVFLVPLLYLTVVSQFDRLRHEHPKCRRHSLADQVVFFHNVLSALLFHVLLGYEQRAAFAIIHSISAALCSFAHWYTLPYYSSSINELFVVAHAVQSFAAAVLAAALLNSTFLTAHAAAPVLLAFGPVVVFGAILATRHRVNPVFEQKLVNCRLEHALTQLPGAEESFIFPEGLYDEQKVPALRNIETTVKECASRLAQFEIHEESLARSSQSQHGVKAAVIAAYINTVRFPIDVDTAASFVAHFVEEMHDFPSIRMLQFAARIYARGLVTFGSDASIPCSFAGFILQFVPPMAFFGLELIDEMSAKEAPLQLRYQAHLLSAKLRVALGIRNQAHTMHAKAARMRHSKVLAHMSDFWLKLTEPSVNIGQVSDVADEITVAREHAVIQFRRALQHQTQNDPVLIHRLGDFLQDVMLDNDGAAECYDEARDLREARQARSMRGTKQITAVETDLETLTDRLIKLLTTRKSDMPGSSAVSTGRLVMQTLAIYTLLLVIGALFIYVATAQRSASLQYLEQVYNVGMLRTSAPLFASTLKLTLLNGTTFTANSSVESPFFGELMGESRRFSRFWSVATGGSSKPSGASSIDFMGSEKIANYIPELDDRDGMSFFETGQLYQSVANQLTSVAANLTAPTVSRVTSIVSRTLTAFSAGSNHYVSLFTKELEQASAGYTVWVIILLVVGAVAIISTLFSLVIGLQRISLSRILTFQLFTLIPFEALEKLAQETKQKMLVIQDEQKPKRASDEGLAEGADSSEAESRRASSSHSSVRSDANRHSMIGVALKSCLKKPGQLKVLKRVVISSIVEILGGKEDTDKSALKKDTTAASTKAVSSLTTEEETERLLMKKSATQTGVQKTLPAKSNEAMYMINRLLLVAGMIVLVLLLIVAVISLAVLLQNHLSEPSKLEHELNILEKLDGFQVQAPAKMEVIDVLFLPDVNLQKALFDLTSFRLSFYDFLEADLPHKSIVDLTEASRILRESTTLMEEMILFRSYLRNQDVNWCTSCLSTLGNRSLEQYVKDEVNSNQRNANRARNRADVINGTDEDFYLIFASLNARSGYNAKESLIHLIESVRTDFSARVEKSTKEAYDSTTNKVALAAVCAGFAFVCALLFLDVSEYSGGFVTRPLIMLTAFSFLLPLGLLATTTSMTSALDHLISEKNQDDVFVGKIGPSILELSMSSRLFAATSTVLYFYTSKAAAPALEGIPSMLSRLGILDADNNATMTQLQRSTSDVKMLSRIATALAINSIGKAVTVEEPMEEAFAAADWNYQLEPDYTFTQSFFLGRTPTYSSRAKDLLLSSRQQWQLAIASVTDVRYRRAIDQCATSYAYLLRNVSAAHIRRITKQMNYMSSLTLASLVSCALPFLVVIFAITRLKDTIIGLLGLKNDTAGATVESTAYSEMVKRAKVSLAVLAAVLCALFAIGYWQTTVAIDSARQIDLATRRAYLIATSLFNFYGLMSRDVVLHSPIQLSENLAALATVSSHLYFGPSSTQRYAIGRNGEFDRISFGSTASAKSFAAVQLAIRKSCEADAALPSASRELFGSLENITVQQAVLAWKNVLFEAAVITSTTPIDMGALAALELFFRALKAPLLSTLLQSTDLLMEAAKQDIEVSGIVLTAVAALFLFCVVVLFFAVFLPMVRKLAEEGESAKLLLRMIPPEVREQVPAISQYIETGRIDNAAELQRKFEASERLLQNILPQKIASRLKGGEQPIADMHRCITILFTDFVGFTKRSSNLQAAQIVDFLNEVFLEFDTVTELLELEKIKTIGDAYFMAGGLDPRMTDHAMRVIEAAFLFFESLRDYNVRHPNPNLLQMRLGIHTGPAVAGVIGTKKVAYDLWGESVEIANAMESTGVPGRIHISEDTAAQVEGFYLMEPRGELPREKEHIPDCMPATFLLTGRLLPTPYQHIQRPKMLRPTVASNNETKANGGH